MVLQLLRTAKSVLVLEGTEGRNPFEVFMLVWCVFVGSTLLLGAPKPGSVQELLSPWMVTTWCILLCIGGLVGLVGVWTRELILSLLVERVAMIVISPSGVLYSVAIFVKAGSVGAPAASIVMAFAIAALGRLIRIQGYLHSYRMLLGKVVE